MAIYRLLQRSAFTPEDIRSIAAAYDDCVRILQLAQHNDAAKERVAKAIIEIAQTGVRDPARLSELALRQIDAAPEA